MSSSTHLGIGTYMLSRLNQVVLFNEVAITSNKMLDTVEIPSIGTIGIEQTELTGLGLLHKSN